MRDCSVLKSGVAEDVLPPGGVGRSALLDAGGIEGCALDAACDA
jgi:hypothetical protein